MLCKFYIAARNQKGELYKLNTMKSIRFSLQRYFLDNYKIDIIDGKDFNESNNIFQNVLKNMKAVGKGDTTHYAEIGPEDLQKLHNGFNVNDPTGIQELIWFNIVFFLIRRGRENIRSMNKNSFSISKYASGLRYIYQTTGESDKNHHINDGAFETNGEGRIYETNGEKCPVKSFIKYISVLNPNLEALWQRPRSKINICDRIWYCNVPLGEKHLGSMFPMLSSKYQLSQRYTNHSLRVTSLQVLEDGNIESRHIMRVSGHKNAESNSNYARRLSSFRKRKISSILANSVGEKENITSKRNCMKDNPSATIQNQGGEDDIDKVVIQLSHDLLSPPQQNMNIIPRVFAPVLNNCSNITFNVNVYNK